MPIALINKYLWDLAKGEVAGSTPIDPTIWNTDSYTYQPFFPVTETLGGETDKTPFVIYDFLYAPTNNTQWFINCEKATLTIVGEIPQVFYVKNFIYETLKKFDTSAQEINAHIDDSDIRFKYIKVEQNNYILDEKRIDSFKPKFATSLTLTYDYTKE
jgi:hypothetical protein